MHLASVAIGLALIIGPLGAVQTNGCDDVGTWTTTCSVSNSGSQVDVTGSMTIPGRTDPAPPSSNGGGSNAARPRPEPEPAPPVDCTRETCGFEQVSLPDVTAEDLASFRPALPSLGGEPAGFGVVGMPANIVAAASEQRIAGTLFERDVVVRFVPVAYVFDYGDGSGQRTTTGGTSWSTLGQAQFTPTATSHVYRARGTYPVTVTVQYEASVDFGTGRWRPVSGYVTATAGGYDVRVVEVRTALVDRTCAENPAGPGC